MLEPQSLKFLSSLKKNNNKPWFDAHRAQYEAARIDFANFMQLVIDQLQKTDTTITGQSGKDGLFRINRDIRFSKDKTPYKTAMGCSVKRGGKKSPYAGYYFHLEPGGKSFVGGGIWVPEADVLKKVRQEIDYNWDEFKGIIDTASFKKTYSDLYMGDDQRLSTAPKGYEKDNAAIEYLKLKSFIGEMNIPDEELTKATLHKKTVTAFEALQPLLNSSTVPLKPHKIRPALCLGLLLLYSGIQAQRITNLVFEGAGIRGIAYAGAVKELEQAGILKDVQRVGGTSAGAVTAMLLSVGYSADELAVIVNSTPFKKLNDGRFFFIGGFNRLRNYFGWYRGRQTEKWLAGLLQTKTGNANITFGQLREKGYKDLYITGTCLNRQRPVVFSAETYPAMKVRDAVRISASVPLYFEPVFLNSSGAVVHHPKTTTGLDVMIDGGITANFPIKLFDSTKYLDTAAPNRYAVNPHTTGFRIDRSEQVEADAEGRGLVGVPVGNLKEYLGAFYIIVIENLNRQTLTQEDWQRTVSIADGNIGPRVKKLSTDEVRLLMNNGAAGWRRFLKR